MGKPKQNIVRRTKPLLVLLAAFCFFLPSASQKAVAATGVPEIIAYQGRLTDASGNLLGGSGTNYFFKFSIWDNPTPSSGTKLWPTGSPGIATISVVSGVFNVNIGDTAKHRKFRTSRTNPKIEPRRTTIFACFEKSIVWQHRETSFSKPRAC